MKLLQEDNFCDYKFKKHFNSVLSLNQTADPIEMILVVEDADIENLNLTS